MKNQDNINLIIAVKKHILLFLVFFMALNHVFGEIKNGYENEILIMRESLNNLSGALRQNNDMSPSKRRQIESKWSGWEVISPLLSINRKFTGSI